MRSFNVCLLAACSALVFCASPAAAQSLKIIHTFDDVAKGARPRAALTSDAAGNFYGTTYTGAPDGNGTVFELSPPTAGKKKWTQTVLHRFNAKVQDGIYPDSSVILDQQGNLYGTTSEGGVNDAGTVFELVAPGETGGKWKHVVLHRFTGGKDGGTPHGTLVFGPDGALYGAAGFGGSSGAGLIYRFAPDAKGKWKEKMLYNFTNGADGGYPYCTPVFDSAGNLYGTTLNGGNAGNGVVFELTPGSGKSWTETVLHSFDNSDDGAEPRMGVIMDSAGNLYGTTETGGSIGYGAVFEMNPPAQGQQSWTESVIYSFDFSPNGGTPGYSGLAMDSGGNLYGTTQTGGTGKNGVAFELSPQQGGAWTETLLHTFEGSPDGSQPEAGLLLGANGDLYGTTFYGGDSASSGVVFRIALKH